MKDETPDTRDKTTDRPAEPEARTPDGGEPDDRTSGIPEGAEGYKAPDEEEAGAEPAGETKPAGGEPAPETPPSTPRPAPSTPSARDRDTPTPGGRSASIVAMLSLLLAVAAVLVSLWTWSGGQDMERRIDSVRADSRPPSATCAKRASVSTRRRARTTRPSATWTAG